MKAALRRQEKAKKEKKAFEMNVVMHDIFEYLLLPRVLACVLTPNCFNSARACSTFKLAATLGEEAFKHDAQGGHTTTNGGAHYARATAAEPKPSADHPPTTEPAQPNACK
mgnify:CR=1 FL=1